jgi:hypothetical protein
MARRLSCLACASALASLAAGALPAQDRAVTYTFFGTPGLLEMPSAISDDDGEIAGSIGGFGGQLRTNFTVQVTPRFSGTFRYARVMGYERPDEPFYDRSFDLRFRLTDEGRLLPAIAVGLRDFMGTGLYKSEYVVATKTLNDQLRATVGLGWGRLGTGGGFTNPLGIIDERFETRPDTFAPREDEGGVPGFEAFFRGDAAVFGGLEWVPNERWVFKLEYSSDDAYQSLDGEDLFDRRIPFNLGVAWRPMPGVTLQAGWMYGSQFALSGSFSINPNERPFAAGLDAPPRPVALRPSADLAAARAGFDPAATPALAERLQASLLTEGIILEAVEITADSARLRYTNTRFRAEAQAMGRILRILTRELPPGVETLTLEPQAAGIPTAAATFARSDVEAFENVVGGGAVMLDRLRLEDAGPLVGLTPLPEVRDPFHWGILPYYSFTFFQDGPINLAVGIQLEGQWRIRPNLILEGELRQRLLPFGEREFELITHDEVPVVRRNARLFGAEGVPVIQRLTLAHYGRPGRDLYSRVTVGYLERMYGGVSTELLWKPVRSPLGFGVEVNYARMREFEQHFGFQDYDVVTGHVSAYYDFQNGFHGQIDAGRYLAGDWGATFSLDREWDNGFRIGGFFTLTDIPFEDYGEGSFDKGIRISLPVDFLFGRPTRRSVDYTLTSLNRDGGERLIVEGRLYNLVRDGHLGDLEDSWGRFWR